MGEGTGALAAALLKAQTEVEAARKTSKNKFHGYKYASAEEMIAVAREALNANGLTFGEHEATFAPFSGELGGAMGVINASYLLQHTSGEERVVKFDIPVCPEAGKSSGWSRPLDKALFGARTEGIGYALRGLLLIEREDEVDVSGREDRPRAEERQTPRAEPAREAAEPSTQSRSAPSADAPSVEALTHAIRTAKDMPGASVALTRARDRHGLQVVFDDAFVERAAHELALPMTGENTVTAMANYLTRATLPRGSAAANRAREIMTEAKGRIASPV